MPQSRLIRTVALVTSLVPLATTCLIIFFSIVPSDDAAAELRTLSQYPGAASVELHMPAHYSTGSMTWHTINGVVSTDRGRSVDVTVVTSTFQTSDAIES